MIKNNDKKNSKRCDYVSPFQNVKNSRLKESETINYNSSLLVGSNLFNYAKFRMGRSKLDIAKVTYHRMKTHGYYSHMRSNLYVPYVFYIATNRLGKKCRIVKIGKIRKLSIYKL